MTSFGPGSPSLSCMHRKPWISNRQPPHVALTHERQARVIRHTIEGVSAGWAYFKLRASVHCAEEYSIAHFSCMQNINPISLPLPKSECGELRNRLMSASGGLRDYEIQPASRCGGDEWSNAAADRGISQIAANFRN